MAHRDYSYQLYPRTRLYVEPRTKEGRSKKEIVRAVKRYVAREVYPYIVAVA